MRYRFLLLLLLAVSFGHSQLTVDSILVDGHYRSFYFEKPVLASNASLLFLMHGSGGSALQMMRPASKLRDIADGENLLIVYPEGYKNFWNECRRASTAETNKLNIDENKFFTEMIGYFKKHYGINEKKVFAAGFSGGGHMAYKLALTMPGKIRAVTAVVANQPDSASSDCIASNKPVPVLIINGTLDPTNPYDGGEMFVSNASFGVVRSSENTFRYWATLAGYSGEPVKKNLPDTDPNDNKTIESYTFKEKGKPEVSLLKVVGGKHDYPNDIDVYLYAWEFFKRQLRKN